MKTEIDTMYFLVRVSAGSLPSPSAPPGFILGSLYLWRCRFRQEPHCTRGCLIGHELASAKAKTSDDDCVGWRAYSQAAGGVIDSQLFFIFEVSSRVY
jgi:hypothetical protein